MIPVEEGRCSIGEGPEPGTGVPLRNKPGEQPLLTVLLRRWLGFDTDVLALVRVEMPRLDDHLAAHALQRNLPSGQ